MFLFRNFTDDVFRQTGIGLIGIGKIFLKVIHVAEVGEGIDLLAFFSDFFFFLFDQFFFFLIDQLFFIISHSCTSYYPLYAS